MLYLESGSTNPYYNLAMEEFIFEQMDMKEDYFMLWQNENTIVVGKYQNTAEEINHRFVEDYGIRVARRLSGGGAVYHDMGNLNFTFVVNNEDDFDFRFRKFAQPVVMALEKFGVHAEFNGRNDLMIDGKKFSGNSQYMKEKRLLYHGCIMLDSNLKNVDEALEVNQAKFDSKSMKSVRSRVTTINACAPHPVSMENFKNVLKECVFKTDDIKYYTPSAQDIAKIEKLKKEKYETWEWNYGKSPAFTVKNEIKFAAGMVSVYMQAENNTIQNIKFFGDFFGDGELSELEQAIVGLTLDQNLRKNLEKLDVGYYMHGISAENICALIR